MFLSSIFQHFSNPLPQLFFIDSTLPAPGRVLNSDIASFRLHQRLQPPPPFRPPSEGIRPHPADHPRATQQAEYCYIHLHSTRDAAERHRASC